MMFKISAVIITLNEQEIIGACIDALKKVVDEIIVVDSFSTDRTKEICLEKNVVFAEHPFKDYIDQKNYAASLANFDFILSIDADEIISDELVVEIKKVKVDHTADGYEFNRLSNYCGKWIRHSGWYPDCKLRLYNRTKGCWTGTTIHEKIKMEDGSKIILLKGDLYHYSYTSITDHIAQANKFSTLGAKSAVQKGRRSNMAKVFLMPLWRFIRNYIFKLGFLDGYYGFVVCVINSHENFLKYAKMIEIQRNKRV
jgi:glycosyltransferase involved in cell wall biosynthesis